MAQLVLYVTRHFLLITATPHNGKEEDFQLFIALLDGDRFEQKFRDGVHAADFSDLMRPMVKENLLKCDGTPLFPKRAAYTVPYRPSDVEALSSPGGGRLPEASRCWSSPAGIAEQKALALGRGRSRRAASWAGCIPC